MEVSHFLAAFICFLGLVSTSLSHTIPRFSLTVAAKDRKVEVTHIGVPTSDRDTIILTANEPSHCLSESLRWTCSNGDVEVLYSFSPSPSATYHKSSVVYKYTDAHEFDKNSRCHSVWAVYLNSNGDVVASTCLMVYPTWMNDLLPNIGGKRIRDLIIPGTHDSGSYREAYEIPSKELPTTKYSLCQDDTIRGQLYQGARYLDIRPAFYKHMPYKWYVNHGITIQHPMKHVMEQVVQFVKETGELVIFGLKEFPQGFNDRDTHRDFVRFLVKHYGAYIVKPKGNNPWRSTLNELMDNPKERIILAYDDGHIVNEFSDVLFPAVHQNWGEVRKWKDLERYLREVSFQDPMSV